MENDSREGKHKCRFYHPNSKGNLLFISFLSLHKLVAPHALPSLFPVTGPVFQIFTGKIKPLQWGLQTQPAAEHRFLVKMTKRIPGS